MGINGEHEKHFKYIKLQPINYKSCVNPYMTGKDIVGMSGALSHIIILSTLQLSLFYYKQTNRNAQLLTSL